MRCLTCTLAVVAGSPSLNFDSSDVTGVSQVIFLASTSLPRSSVVRPFVLDAIMKSVLPSGFAGLPSSRTPKPPEKTTLPFWMMPTATPGMCSAFCPSSMNLPSAAMRAASSSCARLPANDSR